jgi:hypothetical protein
MNEKKPGSHLYGRGYFGLIPLIGFFAGIGLILLGAIKYRNGKLVLIGIAALFPTILIYGSMTLYDYSSSGRSDWTAFNKPNLDELIVNIEFYKKEHKNYPDSLEVLTKEHKFLMISDPVQAFTKNSYGNKYFYKKVGTKYLLFAMGVDGIPFTNDDIFPSPKYFDSTLTGLVRPEN